MSERPPASLTLTALNLSIDGSRVAPEQGKASAQVAPDAALAALQAFERLPAMDLVGVEARLYLAGPQGKVAVQNEGGRLFAALVPETVNTMTESSPENIIALVWSGAPAGPPIAADSTATAAPAESPAPPIGWRQRLASPWTVALLAIVALIMAVASFAPDTPEGVEMIRDGARISALHARFNGRYGAPNSTTLVLASGNLRGVGADATRGAENPLFEKTYGYGLRGGHEVLVVDNGALLEPQEDGSLKFLESTYPPQAR